MKLVAFLILLFLTLVSLSVYVDTQPRAIPYEEGEIQVTFCPVQNCEGALVSALTNASVTRCAFYDFNLEEVVPLLSRADVLIFEENTDALPFSPVISRGLMHHKFCVLDETTVVTGSMNPTVNGVSKNDNNLLLIHSKVLAHAYTQEFAELSLRKEGYKKNSGRTLVNLSGSLVELYFCPQDACEMQVVRTIQSAQHSLYFMTFTFTSDPIGDAVILAHERGVVVEGVFEKRQNSQWVEYDRLAEFNIPVYWDGNGNTMHHKFPL